MAARPFVGRFLSDKRGATAIEYGLICALITLAIIAGLAAFGDKNNGYYKRIDTGINGAL